jgi:molecular chaperone DnaJ
MSQLGSVFDELGPAGGADLFATVDVPRAAVAAGQPMDVRVPYRLPDRDGVVRDRVASPHDAPGCVRVSVPAGTPDGTTLRLRRQGARGDTGVGDLYVTIRLVDGALVVVGGRPAAIPTWVIGAGAIVGFGALLVMC